MNVSNLLYKLALWVSIASFYLTHSSNSQVILDSSLRPQEPLSGPNYAITADRGLTVGNNLFHSFSQFNLDSAETAIFSGPLTINNIISRITDIHPSVIKGSVQSTINGADLFLINPNGIIWGPNSQADILGSLYISTANYLSFDDNGLFDTNAQNTSILTSGVPSSFNFINGYPSTIIVQGSTFSIPKNGSISLIANQIHLADGINNIIEGNLNIIGSEPTSSVTIGSSPIFNVESLLDQVQTSNIEIIDQSISLTNHSFFRLSGHNLSINNSRISLNSSFGNAELLIDVTGKLDLNGSIIQTISSHDSASNNLIINAKEIVIHNGSRLTAISLDGSIGGKIELNADAISIDGKNTDFFTGISSENQQNASGFDIIIQTDNIDITSEAIISTLTQGRISGGRIEVNTENLLIDGKNGEFSTGIFTITTSLINPGPGGDIDLTLKNMDIVNGAEINTSSFGNGQAGNIYIDASQIYLARNDSLILTGIFAQSESNTNGHSGTISINTDSLKISNGALIDNTSFSDNNGGLVQISAKELSLSNHSSLFSSGILSTTFSHNLDTQGGRVLIETELLKISDGSLISTSTFGQAIAGPIDIKSNSLVIQDAGTSNQTTGITSLTHHETGGGNAGNISIVSQSIEVIRGEINASSTGSGDGGHISIQSETLSLIGDQSKQFTGIAAETQSQKNAGSGGGVTITTNDFLISGGAAVTVNSLGSGNAGTISIASEYIYIQENDGLFDTGLFAQSRDDTFGGNGGNIRLNAMIILKSDHGVISSSSEGNGNAGLVEISTGSLILRNESLIDNSNFGFGTGGDIKINAANEIHLDNSFISADADNAAGGNITINSPHFGLTHESAINSTSLGIGKSGDITLNTHEIILDKNSSIQSLNFGTGSGGTINLNAVESISLVDSEINSISRLSDGGNVNINVSKILTLTNSNITSEARLNGGNIAIDPKFVILNNSTLIAKAIQASGGNISIEANVFLQSKNSIIDVSSRFGLSGSINISIPENQNLSNISLFSSDLLLPEDLLHERCDVKPNSLMSTFTVSTILSPSKNPSSYQPFR